MKLHRHLCISVFESLHDIFVGGYHADKVVERQLRNSKKWGARDRQFVAESVYEMVRWWRLLNTVALIQESDLFAPRNEAQMWKLFAIDWTVRRRNDLPEWTVFKGFNKEFFEKRWTEMGTDRRVRESIPDWLDELGVKELGDARWTRILTASNKQADVILRTNSLKISPEDLQHRLHEEEIECHSLSSNGLPLALRLRERANVFRTKCFKDGLFEVQDSGSQRVAPLTLAQPGERVIDACAGAGGKTLHLACLMKNKGKIIALDIHEHKLQALKLRARRGGVSLVEMHVVDSHKVIKRLHGTADAVLLDVPCSGLGVLRRHPDTKWKLTEENLKIVRETQRDILMRYSLMAKPQGRLVYATCSVLPSENQEQIKWFLANSFQETSRKWKLDEEIVLTPDADGADGFYGARLLPVT